MEVTLCAFVSRCEPSHAFQSTEEPLDLKFFKNLKTLCEQQGVLLLLDEVQCGNGRTGKMWAHEWAEIEPDALATAKGLGGGFPIGALMAKRDAAKGLTPGTHGTTCGGNPMAMAIANAVLDVLQEEGFLQHIVEVGEHLWAKLDQLVARHVDKLAGFRGAGLMQGIVCSSKIANTDLLAAAKDKGLLTVAAGDNTLRLLPPLIAGKSHIDEAVEIIDNSLTELTG